MLSASPYMPQAPDCGLKIKRAGVADAGFAGFAALDAADAEKFFAVLLQVGFTDFTFFPGTTRIIPTPMLKDCSNSPVSIFPSLARYLKIGSTGQDARSISAFTPLGSTRGKFPGMPPPVMCARAETQPRATMFFSAGA